MKINRVESTGLIRLSTAKSVALLKVAVPPGWKLIALALIAVSFGVQSITVCPPFKATFVIPGEVVTTAPLVVTGATASALNDCAAAGLGPTTSDVAIASVEHNETRFGVRTGERVIMTSTAEAGW
jgi:hypothetical protein